MAFLKTLLLTLAVQTVIWCPVSTTEGKLYYHTDCTNFRKADALLFAAGHLYVVQPSAKNIMVVNPDRLQIVKTINVPGTECGGDCYPFGIAIKPEHMLLAIAAKSQMSGGESKVMLFKITGDLSQPSGIAIEHYYTFLQLLAPVGHRSADVRDVAFCGDRLAYADYNGVIRNYGMPKNKLYYGWNDGKPEPDLTDRLDWYLDRNRNTAYGKQYYLGCSNNGKHFVVEKTREGNGDSGNTVAAVPSSVSTSWANILDRASAWVKPSNWSSIGDHISRMNRLKGIAMDSFGNLFYSSEKHWSNGASGVYMRLSSGQRGSIREWSTGVKKDRKLFGMAADERFLYWVQQDPSSNKCLRKYDFVNRIAEIKG